jgi:hypothetical protein
MEVQDEFAQRPDRARFFPPHVFLTSPIWQTHRTIDIGSLPHESRTPLLVFRTTTSLVSTDEFTLTASHSFNYSPNFSERRSVAV